MALGSTTMMGAAPLLLALGARSAAAPPPPPSLPDLCRLANATFELWDAPSARCKSCAGAGSGSLLPASGGAGCDGVRMESEKGMAASFVVAPFIVEPTAVYSVKYEVSASGLVATTAFLTDRRKKLNFARPRLLS